MGVVVTILIALFGCYVGYLWLKYKKFKSTISWAPTVQGWPVLGNALEFGDTEKILKDIQRLIPSKEKMVFLNVFYNLNLFTTDYDLIEFILSNQNILKKGDDYRFLKRWLETGLLVSDGAKWRTRRRLITPAFHFSILEQFIDVFESNGIILIDKIKKVFGQDSVDVYPFITAYALDVICECAMGVKKNAQEDENNEYAQYVRQMCKIGMLRVTSIIKNYDLLYRFTPTYYQEQKVVKALHAVTNEIITKRRIAIQNEQNNDLIDELGRKKRMSFIDILLKSTVDGQPLSQEDIREEVDTFMFEGHDTTSSAMTFCIYCIANHPEVQEKILNEQKEIFGDNINRPSTYKDLQEMKYLECVLKETLRLYPSVAMYSRKLTEDVNYKGNILPKGLGIVIFDYGVLRDPDYYPNPEKFDPDRFEEIDGTRPYQYIPFSAGPRNCIGQKFAYLEMKSTISKIVRNVEILPATPEHKLKVVTEAVLKSANGVRVKFMTRKW